MYNGPIGRVRRSYLEAAGKVDVTTTIYLLVMVGIIAVVTAVSVPSLFFRKCPACGKRNAVDADRCRACSAALPQEDP